MSRGLAAFIMRALDSLLVPTRIDSSDWNSVQAQGGSQVQYVYSYSSDHGFALG